MEDKLRVNASIVSSTGGINKYKTDNYYMNGRFMFEHETNSVQVSTEDIGSEYLFAVSDGMDRLVPEKGMVVSLVKELQKFHSRVRSSGKDITVKLEQLCECVEEVNNLLLSASLGDDIDGKLVGSFAGLFVSGRRAAVISSGSTRAYLLREDNLTQLVSDNKKAARLLKLGIITDEQAEELARQFRKKDEDNGAGLRKTEIFDVSPGDTILLCTDGFPETIDDDTLFEILAKRNDSSYSANSLIKEAIKHGTNDNVTVLVVKIKEEDEGEGTILPDNRVKVYRRNHTMKQEDPEEKSGSVWKAAAVFALCILIPVAIFWSYKLLFDKPEQIPVVTKPIDSTTTQTEGTDEEEPDEYTETDPSAESPDQEEEPQDTQRSPEDQYYVVKSGDSLYSISMQFYGDPQKVNLIIRANNITDPNYLMEGQKLKIPPAEQGE